MGDIWEDVPIATVDAVEQKNLEFDSVASFRDWLATEPGPEDLLIALTAEREGKNRKTIIKEINQALNG